MLTDQPIESDTKTVAREFSRDITDMANEIIRLRSIILEMAKCRMDETVVREIAQRELGFDPDTHHLE